jgi:hypothetical protein
VTWCGAAYMYAKEILHYNMTAFVPCLLLVKAPHYHHLNLKTISAKQSNRTHFQIIGGEMLQFYRDLYPTWDCLETFGSNATLPHHADTILRHVTSYPKTCPFYNNGTTQKYRQ